MKMGPMITTVLLTGASLFSAEKTQAQTADSTLLGMRNFAGIDYREQDSVMMIYFDARDSLYLSNHYTLVVAKKDANGNRIPDIGEKDLMACYSTKPNSDERVLLDLRKKQYSILSLTPQDVAEHEDTGDDMEFIRNHFENGFKRFKKEVGKLDDARKQIKDYYGYTL